MSQLINIDAERALIGSVLINPDQYHEVEHIKPEHFGDLRHKWIWDAICELVAKSEAVDIITVSERAKPKGNMGGSAYLMELVNASESSMSAPTYAGIVEDMSLRRNTFFALQDAVRLVHKMDIPAAEIIEQLSGKASDLANSASSSGIVTMADLVREYDDAVQGKVAPVKVFPMRSCELNRIFGGGLVAPRVAVVAGHPKTGKTILMQRIAMELALNGHSCFFVSQEMEGWDLVVRGLSAEARIPEEDLHVLKLDGHHDDYISAIERMEKLPIYISDKGQWSMTALRAQMFKLQRDKGVHILLIDYLGLLADNPKLDDEFRQLAWKTGELKRMAKDLQIAVLVLHTVNAQGEQSGGTGPVYKLDLALTLMTDKEYQAKYEYPEKKRTPFDNARWLRETHRRYGKWQTPAEFTMDADYPILRDALTVVGERT